MTELNVQQSNKELNYAILQLSEALHKNCSDSTLVVCLSVNHWKAEESIAHCTASTVYQTINIPFYAYFSCWGQAKMSGQVITSLQNRYTEKH